VLLALASIASRISGSQLALTDTAEDGTGVSEPGQTLICESSTMRY
jgi:hypothetical protein